MDNKNNIHVKKDSGEEETSESKGNKSKTRGRKRKRKDSESSTDIEEILPENTLEVEKNLKASAVKNNLDDQSVKKILKKVVTNEHVFALVKLQEERDEAAGVHEVGPRPKITRSRMKELMKVSPKTPGWNLELTPIKHIPVKTRPEVKALIAQELQEDEDDEEYEPTHDDVPSDDDQTLESCSDLDSQPRTPATPGSVCASSPRVLQDGPFKVPQDLRTPARKRLNLEEEPTIALRTRSKLSLSATSIEHIESSFIPPDDIPAPDIEDPVWNEFVNDILDPTSASVSRVEEDDEADPEYNVAADPDAEEDEEALENSIVNISKKELNDLFTELFDIMPVTAETVINEDLLIERGQSVVVWEGKKEPEPEDTEIRAEKLTMEKRDSFTRLSVGKTEPHDPDYHDSSENVRQEIAVQDKENIGGPNKKNERLTKKTPKKSLLKSKINVYVEERIKNEPIPPLQPKLQAPAALRSVQESKESEVVHIEIDVNVKILPEQIQILQQQLRQHIQLSASNFLQLFVNPSHWKLAPCYKEYLMQLNSLLHENPNSVVNVCNLKPAVELVESWEKTVSEDTPENKQMVEFIQSEAERSRRGVKHCSLYVGEFPEMFKRVVANSSVFLYPYLLPAMPYRADHVRRFGYRRCEDHLIVLGLDQFWQYVESNPEIYPLRKNLPRGRPGMAATCELVCKHMFPWLTLKMLTLHVQRARKEKNSPMYNFFKNRHVEPVKHRLLPYNPDITLYEQPEHEVPRIWVRYLAKSSKRFRDHLFKRKNSGLPPAEGVLVEFGSSLQAPKKNPLPIDFTKKIVCTRTNLQPKSPDDSSDKFDVNVQTNITANVVNNLTQNIMVFDNVDATGKVMVLGANFLPVGKVLPSPRKCVDNTVTSTLEPDTNIAQSNITAVSDEVNNSGIENATKVNQVITNNNVSNAATTQMFRVVQTTTGVMLVPLSIETNTVNSINGPISTVKENTSTTSDTYSAGSKPFGTKDHCRCCILLQKICKGKQATITDYFKPNIKSEQKPCECTKKKYPKSSYRFNMLIKNYKTNSWCVFRELKTKMNESKSEKVNNECEDKTRTDDTYDLDDIAAIVTFQMKVTALTTNYRNYTTKTRVYNLFKNYNDADKDPLYVAEELYKLCEIDLIELYKEFMGFLTVEQAEKIDRFKDYFLQRCVKDIIKKVEQEVSDKDVRHKILSQVDAVIRQTFLKSCEMCCSLLQTMDGLPKLARYVFSLFPHRTVEKNEHGTSSQEAIKRIETLKQQNNLEAPNTTEQVNVNLEDSQQLVMEFAQELDQAEDPLIICEESQNVDYEADHSSCGEDNNNETDTQSVLEQSVFGNTTLGPITIKLEPMPDKLPESVNTELTVHKTEALDSYTTENSITIVEEEEPVKTEAPEWRRDEDKLILEVLTQHITLQDRQDKRALNIMDEKNLYQLLAESLTTKSLVDIKDRVIYLLEILVLSEFYD